MSHDPMRERAFGLLSELCGSGEIPTEALRTASHTLFDVARHAGPETLYAVSEALPWMAAFVSMASGDLTQQDAATELFARGALHALPPAALNRRLREAVQATLRSPTTSVDGPLAQALVESAKLDQRLTSLIFRDDDQVRAEILDDAELLSAALEVCESDDELESEARRRLRGLFPQWCQPDIRPRSRAIRVLDGLESSWDGGIIARVAGFSERSRRFELSSVDHLRRSGYLETVRAALAFAPVEDSAQAREELERDNAAGRVEPGVLRQFPVFADDPPLEALTLALIEMRGKSVAYLRGAAPFADLSPWVDYLRGPCAELAESRDITLREATSFAHFALHLMNFCDLVAFHRGAATDDVRRSIMDVEDELKEFALAYQREGLHDGASDLARFDEARWRSSSPESWLADRLARLRGGWRDGSGSKPVGAPPRVHEETLEHHLAIVQRLEADDAFVDPLSNLLKTATINGVRWLETLEADHILSLLSLAARAARDSATVDTAHTWRLDVEPIAGWATGQSAALRAEVLRELLDRTSPSEILAHSHRELSRGLSAFVPESGVIALRFAPDAELEAILTLLSAAGDDAAMRTVLQARLDGILAADVEEDHTQELVLSAAAREELGL